MPADLARRSVSRPAVGVWRCPRLLPLSHCSSGRLDERIARRRPAPEATKSAATNARPEPSATVQPDRSPQLGNDRNDDDVRQIDRIGGVAQRHQNSRTGCIVSRLSENTAPATISKAGMPAPTMRGSDVSLPRQSSPKPSSVTRLAAFTGTVDAARSRPWRSAGPAANSRMIGSV